MLQIGGVLQVSKGVLTKTDDASNTLYSERYQQTYHSTFGALSESMHVFLHGANVVERLSAGQPTRVLEIGLGLGLNCLLSADVASTHQTPLDYTGIENDLITTAQLQSLGYQQLLREPALVEDFAQLLGNPNHPAKLGEHTSVTLQVADATSEKVLDNLATQPTFHAIYHDAFSPEHNPECWTLAFFQHMFRLLASDGILATYCVKGTVRRNLEAAGFMVQKYPGPTGKREVLRACIPPLA